MSVSYYVGSLPVMLYVHHSRDFFLHGPFVLPLRELIMDPDSEDFGQFVFGLLTPSPHESIFFPVHDSGCPSRGI